MKPTIDAGGLADGAISRASIRPPWRAAPARGRTSYASCVFAGGIRYTIITGNHLEHRRWRIAGACAHGELATRIRNVGARSRPELSASAGRSGSGCARSRARSALAPMTVSRVLSNPELVAPATRAKVLEAIEQAGFVPNRLASCMRGAGRMIGTVVPPLINSGIAEQVQGMSDECHEQRLLDAAGAGRIHPGGRGGGDPHPARLAAGRDDPAELRAERDARARCWSSSGVPVVEISEIKGREPIDMAVGVSNFETAYAMTMHLARKGYRRIGFVSTPIHGNDRLQQRRHRLSCGAGRARHGATSDMEVEVPITAQGGAEALAALTDRHTDIDAIFFSSDTLAVGAIQECHRRGWEVPGAHRHRRLWRHGSRGAALSAADHGAGRPLRDGAAGGAAIARAARRRRARCRRSPASASRSSTARAPEPGSVRPCPPSPRAALAGHGRGSGALRGASPSLRRGR